MQDILNILRERALDPAVLAVFISALVGAWFYRRQLVLKAKMDSSAELTRMLRELREQTNNLVGNYRQILDIAAQIGDEFGVVPQDANEVKKFWEDLQNKNTAKFDKIDELINNSYAFKRQMLDIITGITENPLVPKPLRKAVRALDNEFQDIKPRIENCVSILINLNTARATQDVVNPQLFANLRDTIENVIKELNEFLLLTWDLRGLLHNNLVGDVLPKIKPDYTARRTLTKRGVIDFRSGFTRRQRLRELYNMLFE